MAKNIALVTAGGIGSRMESQIPKQFINVYDKPVIIYTLECFQKHHDIDAIVVVCLQGWEHVLNVYAKQFGISKLASIVPGGETGFKSIINGVNEIRRLFSDDDIVLVHDGIRPNLESKVIDDNLAICKKYGNAITTLPCRAAMIYTENGFVGESEIDRDKLSFTQTPQTFKIGDLYRMQCEAIERGITNTVAPVTLCTNLGYKVYFAPGSEKNVKLTVQDDIDIFKALLRIRNEKLGLKEAIYEVLNKREEEYVKSLGTMPGSGD